MSVFFELLREHAASRGEKVCFSVATTGETISYAQLWRATLRIFQKLESLNVRQNDRVAYICDGHWCVFPLLAACAMRSAKLVLINPRYHPREIARLIAHAAPTCVVADRPVTFAGLRLTPTELVDGPESTVTRHPIVESGVALIIYTSGTTETSKAVMLSERNLFANASSIADRYDVTSADTLLSVLPLFHMNAMLLTGWLAIVVGAHVVLGGFPQTAPLDSYWEQVSKWKVSICSLTPWLLSRLLAHPVPTRAVLDAVRFVFCGAGPLTAATWRQFEDRFGIPVYQGYGLTETTCWATSVLPSTPRNYHAVGMPLDCEIRISPIRGAQAKLFADRRHDGSAVVERRGTSISTVGEIEVKGPIVMAGYFKSSSLTDKLLSKDGFFRTGDAGFLDDNCQLQVVGRLKDIIIREGERIWPDEIDSVLIEMPEILEAKTIGVSDARLNELVCTVAVVNNLDQAPTSAAIMTFLAERIASFKLPDRVLVTTFLPRSAAGQIARHELRDLVTGKWTEEILERIDTWKYKRSHPSALDRIKDTIQTGLLRGCGPSFVAYWGCGVRDSLVDADLKALTRLAEFVTDASRPQYASATLTLVLTDVHARVNGKPEVRALRYFDAVSAAARARGFATVFLSEVWRKYGFDVDAILDPAIVPEPPEQMRARLSAVGAVERYLSQAKKHAEGQDPDVASRRYLAACQYDAVAMDSCFRGSIFLTYNGPDADVCLPELPKMYLYSTERKNSEKPWFMS